MTEGVWRSEETQDVREEGTKPASAQGSLFQDGVRSQGGQGYVFRE